MKIQPIQTNQPTFQMKWKQKKSNDVVKTVINLDNGNRLQTRQTKDYKLQTLYDKFGNWVKSKLRYYKGRQVVRELRSFNDT